ncbi:hypothetical protein B9479_003986 [Cryptococcus floricola]|uniref:Dynactin subunit 6 n=1 Tax=Cryptococcus floricola TaxID=2591691 RepID=A0A5D3AYN5_9TREE|nr:hypothetical protein B9479_003986 [Cryptococcus floricola]
MSRAPSSITAHSTSIVCLDTDLRGTITIGAGVIVHPKATIFAAAGPIVIGDNCVIEEDSIIINRHKEIMRIGEQNHFMVGCRVEAPSIGDYNTFQPRCTVSSQVAISDHCILSAGTIALLAPGSDTTREVLPPYTVIYGADSSRRIWVGSGEASELALRARHSEYLREILPKFNRLRPTGSATPT